MAKTKISEFSATAADNTDITNINIAEGCSPANLNNAVRSLMALLKDQQAGTSGDPFTVAGTLVSSGTVDITGAFRLDGTAGASGQILLSAGGSNTPTWGAALGTMASQNSTAVAITGGTITGITDLTVADGGTGASSITTNSVILGNGTSALSGNLVAPGTSGNVLTSNGTTWTSAVANTLTSGTSQATTSGTSIDFTSIPSSIKMITVMFNGVSTNGTSIILVQLGDSGGIETTGYVGASSYLDDAASAAATSFTNGIALSAINTAGSTFNGLITICNVSSNVWVASGNTSNPQIARTNSASASKTLSGVLDRIRLTTVNGTDTFDAGSINILYQ
jgi:hypothetical protein